MPWNLINPEDLRLTPSEKAAFAAIQDSDAVGANVLANVVSEFRDTIAAAGTALGAAGTVPDLVRLHVLNRARWLWLCEFPQLKAFQTDARKALNEAAEKMLADLSSRAVKVPPGDGVVATEGAPADQTPSPGFGTRTRNFTAANQDGL